MLIRQQLQNPGQRPKAVDRPGQESQGMPPKLVARIQRLQQGAQDMQRKMQELQKIMQKIGMLIQQKKFDQANLVMDEAFKLTEPTDVSTDR